MNTPTAKRRYAETGATAFLFPEEAARWLGLSVQRFDPFTQSRLLPEGIIHWRWLDWLDPGGDTVLRAWRGGKK